MKFSRLIKPILSFVFVLSIVLNAIMYFEIVDSVNVFGKQINVLYIQIFFLLLEGILLSGVYGKKQGLTICLIYVIVVALNFWFTMYNVVS